MARQSGPDGRPGSYKTGADNPGPTGGKRRAGGPKGPVFQEILWLQRWPRLVSTLFIFLILLEILLFLWVAERIGLALTLLALIGSAVVGLWLIRRTGLDMVGKLRLSLAQGHEPGHSLVDGACFVLAGLLLILPGFFSDLMAVLLMLPLTRNWLIRHFASKLMGGGFAAGATATRGKAKIITDVEFREVDPGKPAPYDDPLDQPFAEAVEKAGDAATAKEEPATTGDGAADKDASSRNTADPSADPSRGPTASQPIVEAEILVPERSDRPAETTEAADSAGPEAAPTPPADDDERWGRAPRRPIIDVDES